MKSGLPQLAFFACAILFFASSIVWRRHKVALTASESQRGLLLKEKSQRAKLASWLFFAAGCAMVAAAILEAFAH